MGLATRFKPLVIAPVANGRPGYRSLVPGRWTWALELGAAVSVTSLTVSLLTAQALARWVRVQALKLPIPKRLQRLPSNQDSQRVSELAVDPRPVRISPNERQRLPTRSLSKEPLFKRPCLALPLLLSILPEFALLPFALCYGIRLLGTCDSSRFASLVIISSHAPWFFLLLFPDTPTGHHSLTPDCDLRTSLPGGPCQGAAACDVLARREGSS
ncbi:hypothetical protein CNYM01_06810 [Colletotrichum nymphaeae SA-01]|uniref:Uncharacterized protein n=1 Tax=Colletotrichum nymphaeae SA-01 TaxID=1460502 RepID=A0A135S8M4_9PEZI|nr:hypothetical protein CNYM01_06810 [Colletotrichum nymphaeae SA-01]